MKEKKDPADKLAMFLPHLSEEQLAAALAMQREGDERLLGLILVEKEWATPEEVERALILQRARRGQLGHVEGMALAEGASAAIRAAADSVDALIRTAEAAQQQRKKGEE